MIKTVILASGKGSNAKKILECQKLGKLPNIEIVALISDKEDANALKVAKEFGVKSVYLDPMRKGAFFNEEGAKFYLENLEFLCADFIVLAGFMRILPPSITSKYANKIINLHPSLLPSFKGKDAIKQAFDCGVKITGCTVHFVNDELDGGKIIDQKAVEIAPEDTLESLEEKVHAAEHVLLPSVIAKIGEGKIPLGK